MTEIYDLVAAGPQTDYSVFWQFFDNYIVNAARLAHLDELVINLYLTDSSHRNFYDKIYSSSDPLHLILFYRRKHREDSRESEKLLRRNLFRHIYHQKKKESQRYLHPHPVRHTSSNGECIGFCIYEWDRSFSSRCSILALSIDPDSQNHAKKAKIWQLLEQRLYTEGVRTLETSSYQEPEFWLRNGFAPDMSDRLVKSLGAF